MSGYADYFNEDLPNYEYYNIPVVEATPENFKEYGNFVYDYPNEEVIITPWPTPKRPLMPDTGVGGGITEGEFEYKYDRNFLIAKNHAVDGTYVTGINYEIRDGEYGKVPYYILTREANYHPDGGQVFYPIIECPFILLLALPNDDVKLEHFKAFRFTGKCGAQIKPFIWHQPVFPIANEALFMTKQGKVHACVGFDSITECGKWMRIQLK